MPKNRLLKPFGIAKVDVWFHATGEKHTHPEIFFKNAHDETIVRVKFQSHKLGVSDGLGGEHPTKSYNTPDDRFDFGYPYSACYAARWVEAGSYSYGSLKAEPNRSAGNDLRKLARLADKIQATVREFNLAHVAPNCELALWVEALEKLGVEIEIHRSVGRTTLERYAWRSSLTDLQKTPGRDLIEGRAKAEQMNQA